MRVFTTRLGPQFSEGSRLLCIKMKAQKLSQASLCERLERGQGVVGRWMRGDRRPDAPSRLLLEKLLGISPASWDARPTRPFKFAA